MAEFDLEDFLSRKDFLGGYNLLLEKFGSVEVSPAIWQKFARQAASSGFDAIAAEIYRQLWAHDITSVETAHFIAGELVTQLRYSEALSYLHKIYGDTPDTPEARLLLAKCMLQSAPDDALRLLEQDKTKSEEHAVVAIDALRSLERLVDARDLALLARDKFSGSTRIATRLPRIEEALGHWHEAIQYYADLPREIADSPSSLAHRIRLSERLETQDKTAELTANLLAKRGFLASKLQVADILRQNHLALSLVESRFLKAREEGIDESEWIIASRQIADFGYSGLNLWLEAQGMPTHVPSLQALRELVPFEVQREIVNGSLANAFGFRSPEILLPQLGEKELPYSQHAPDEPILLVNATLALGGAERQFLNLVTALLSGDVEPARLHCAFFSLASDRRHDRLLPELKALGVQIHDLNKEYKGTPALGKFDQAMVAALPLPIRSDVLALINLLRILQPKIVHGWQDRAGLAAAFGGTMAQVPRIVISARNMRPEKRGQIQPYNQALYQYFATRKNITITANSDAGARDFEQWLGLHHGSIALMRNAVDVSNLPAPQLSRTNQRLKEDTPLIIGGVFRLAANKRPILWIETLAELQRLLQRPVKAKLYGHGPLEPEILKKASCLAPGSFTHESFQASPANLYRDLDAFLLMSRVEGLPNVLLEAQGCGVPVAACDVGGVREAVHPNSGLLLDVHMTAGKAASAIAEWLPGAVSQDKAQMREFVNANFGFDALATKVRQMYKYEVLG